MWLVVFVSHNGQQVKALTKMLFEHNILSKVRRRQSDVTFYEVFVPQTEIREAQNLIFDSDVFN